MPEVDALIVDLDGVIRHWDNEHFAATARSFGVEPARFAEIAFEKSLLDAGMTGALVYEAWAEEIGRRVAAAHGCDAAAVTEAFGNLRWSVDWDVVELLREVRESSGAKLALFSNASTNLEKDLASVALDVEFDVVFNSARLGMAKPDPQAFAHVAAELDVPIERCLFVDDTVPNVHGAREAGMQAAPFTAVPELRALLERAGLMRDPAP